MGRRWSFAIAIMFLVFYSFSSDENEKELKNLSIFQHQNFEAIQNSDSTTGFDVEDSILTCTVDFAGSVNLIEQLKINDSLYFSGYTSVHDSLTTPSYNQSITDSVYQKRFEYINSITQMHFEYKPFLRRFIEIYTVEKREKTQKIIDLSSLYFPLFERIILENNLPEELKFLAVIESALNPEAVSRVGATGLWQFMYATGRERGLNIKGFYDDRIDPILSTQAAVRHLKTLYKLFNKWDLALAAYNSGQGRVKKALRYSGKSDPNYWEVYAHLPRETRGYIPIYQAATYLFYFYKEHGFQKKKTPYSFHKILPVEVNTSMSFKQISQVVGVSQKELKLFNPKFYTGWIDCSEKKQSILLPKEYISIFEEKKNEIPLFNSKVENATTYAKLCIRVIKHKIRNGESLWTISRKHKVSIQKIRAWNNLRGNMIRAGKTLRIYLNP